MTTRRTFLASSSIALLPAGLQASTADLDPKGAIHIPIGIPNTLDTLKTFVEREGNFSPGVGTYGVYWWVWTERDSKLFAPTMEGSNVEHGLTSPGLLIPWTRWRAGDIEVTTELCQVEETSPAGPVYVAGARAHLKNLAASEQQIALYIALRPLGPAGGDVAELRVDRDHYALLVNGHPALVAETRPSGIGVLQTDRIAELAASAAVPLDQVAVSPTAGCSGAMRFDLTIAPDHKVTVRVLCPVLPGRSAARHHWVDGKQNAMVDEAELNPRHGGIPQPDPGSGYYRSLSTDHLFAAARDYWMNLLNRIDIQAPDPRWGESMRAILGHAALCMNEGAPDVAVLNYNVFNRDGMYLANMMQKAGLASYSEQIIDYFFAHPFNGRAYPEADNPGQVLWAIEQHWLMSRNLAWLSRVYPSIRSIAQLIRYYRTTPGPHWVSMESLQFGSALAEEKRRELVPGKCDGFHPEYTEAFDVAGLRGAARLAEAAGLPQEVLEWQQLAENLFRRYDNTFGSRLPKQYGNYCVLWPCRLYPLEQGNAYEQFRGTGAQAPKSWRYFPLATAHQGLLAHNREAGFRTLETHLAHEQMRGWYAFDEGGGSGSGAWYRTRTKWTHSREKPGENRSVAMPHGWAIAEFWLLLRDSLVFEDGDKLVLLAGVPPDWFRARDGIHVKGLATHFGPLDLNYSAVSGGAQLSLGGANPAQGFVLRLPFNSRVSVIADSKTTQVEENGDCLLPPGTSSVQLRWL